MMQIVLTLIPNQQLDVSHAILTAVLVIVTTSQPIVTKE